MGFGAGIEDEMLMARRRPIYCYIRVGVCTGPPALVCYLLLRPD